MEQPTWIAELFRSIDQKDARTFSSFLTPDARFRFASAPVVEGAPAIGDAVVAFFATIEACQHQLADVWVVDKTVICRGQVTYTRLDNSKITLPFVDVFDMRGDKIEEYAIYMDISPLYVDTEAP